MVERDPRVIYVATASSGVWKTTNAGTTWAAVFEKENTVSLGGIAVSQSNPDVVAGGFARITRPAARTSASNGTER